MKNLKIAIVGGGPGGLTLARLLQLKGANVKVYERDHSQEARVQGAIVDLHFDSGLKVMEAAGLMDAFKASYMVGADKYRVVDKHADILLDESADAGFGDEHFRPEIDRGALRDLLIDSLLPGTVLWDRQLISMEKVNNIWELRFKNGTTATADLVIGSDGHRSKIRPYVTDTRPLYSGATIIQGEVEHPGTDCPEIYTLMDKANLMAMSDQKTIAVQPRGDGGMTFYAVSMYPEHWVENSGIDFNKNEEVCAYLAEFYEGWHPLFHEMFKASGRFVPRPLNYFPLDQHWDTRSDITLIGDAAHLMPPSGEGVNTAMLDALDLSECLFQFDDLNTAIAAYEEKMFARAVILGKEAVEGIRGFAAPSDQEIGELVDMFKQQGQ